MTKLKGPLLFSALFLLGLASACSRSSATLPLAEQGIDLPAKQVNTNIQIGPVPDSAEAFGQIGVFYCRIQNLTESPIVFPPDYGLRVFLRDGAKWTELEVAVPDNIALPSANEVVLPKGQNPAGNYYPVNPTLPTDHSRPVTLRLVVLGSIDNGLGKHQVAAYTDVTFP